MPDSTDGVRTTEFELLSSQYKLLRILCIVINLRIPIYTNVIFIIFLINYNIM